MFPFTVTQHGHTCVIDKKTMVDMCELLSEGDINKYCFSLPTMYIYLSRGLFFRKWSDSDRRKVIEGRYFWAKRVFIREALTKKIEEVGFVNVRSKL